MRKLNILIVDDEPQIRDLIAWELEDAGFEVTLAGGVLDAKEQLLSHAIDAVISDVRMPGGGGEVLLEHVRQLEKPLPVIFITGYSDFSKFEAREKGASAYFLKPFDMDELIGCVRSLTAASS